MGQDRIGKRLEQRQEPVRAVSQRPRRDRQAMGSQPFRNLATGPMAHIPFVEVVHPHADPERRAGKQPQRRRRDHFAGHAGTVAGLTPASTNNPADMGLDLDLDDLRGPISIGDIRFAAAGTQTGILGRIVTLFLLLEIRACGTAMTRLVLLLAARAITLRLLLLFAPGAVQGL